MFPKTVAILLGGFLLGLGLTSAAPAKKKATPTKTVAKSKGAAPKKRVVARGKAPVRARTANRKSYARSRGRGPAPVAARRYRGQQSPTQERFTEIQQALIQRGFLSGTPSGVWSAESIEAVKRFQQEQNLPANGKVTSLTLIALGLGPQRNPPPNTAQLP
ncbi:MAG: hypothetical protein FJW30_18545 [Acidobacteria bacterium]|nr:hypothetical protein [Acidobacteriota bacterium]